MDIKLNILQINTADNQGGAAKIAYGIKSGLEKRGHTTSMFVRHKYSNDANIFYVQKPSRLLAKLSPLFKRNLEGTIRRKLPYYLANDLELFPSSNKILETKQFKSADIVHCHNLHSGYFNLKTLQKIAKEKPVVWTFHDMWPITAHGAHSFDGQVKNGFFECPSLDVYPPIAWHNENYLMRKKRKIYQNSPFHIVAQSLWTKGKIEESLLKDKPTSLIYNGVDTNIFKPYLKNEARIKLSLPLTKKIILFLNKGGEKNAWKGGQYVQKIIDLYGQHPDFLFIYVGGEKKIESNIIKSGYVEDENLLAQYYSAADIFLYPSLAESFGLVVAEAQACGLLTVAFQTGGIPEIVDHKKTGYIAEYKNAEDLVRGVEYILALPPAEAAEMKNNAIKKVNNNFSLDTMVDNYINLYQKILGNSAF